MPGDYQSFTVNEPKIDIEGPNMGIEYDGDRGEEARIEGQITIKANNVSINGLYMDAEGFDEAVNFADVSYININNNIFKNAQTRGFSADVDHLTVRSNMFYSTGEAGIDNIGSDNQITIKENKFEGISPGAGIVLGSDVNDNYVSLEDNKFKNNYWHLQSDTVFEKEEDLYPDNIMENNIFPGDEKVVYDQEPEWVILDEN